MARKKSDPVREALLEFVKDVEDTGGVVRLPDSTQYEPKGDREWTDLGTTYIHACRALKRPPMVEEE